MSKTARKPAAAKVPAIVANAPAVVPGAPAASNLPANVAPLPLPAALPAAPHAMPDTLPAFDNWAGWNALTVALPAVADARAGKYGEGKLKVPCDSTLYSLTPYGVTLAQNGSKKNGKPNAQAATCRALALAIEACGTPHVCGAAVVYFALTHESVLALFRASKAAAGASKGPRYLGRTGTPCPAWVSGYVKGNAREDMFNKA